MPPPISGLVCTEPDAYNFVQTKSPRVIFKLWVEQQTSLLFFLQESSGILKLNFGDVRVFSAAVFYPEAC